MEARISSLYAVLLAVVTATASAHAQFTFNVHLDSLHAGSNGTGNSVREVPGGSLVFGWQYSADELEARHIFLRRLDPMGHVISELEYTAGDDRHYATGGMDPMATMPDGSFVVAVSEGSSFGDSTWLYRYNELGERISRQYIMSFPAADSTLHSFYDVTTLSDGGFALCGTIDHATSTARALLVRLGADGSVTTVQDYVHAQALVCVREMPDGGLVVTGYRGPGLDRNVLFRTEPGGDIQWVRYSGGQGGGATGSVRVDADGAVINWNSERSDDIPIYEERMVLTKRTSTGNLLWERSTVQGSDCIASDFEKLPDGGFIGTGMKQGKGVLVRYDLEGSMLWTREYTVLNGQHSFGDVELTSDGGFLLTGMAGRFPPLDPDIQTNYVTWVVKTDSVGCVVPGCQNVGIEEVALGLDQYLSISPNPVASGQPLRITFEPPAEYIPQGPLRVAVVDATGRLVLEEQMGGATLYLSMNKFTSGLYYLHLTDGTRWLAGGKVLVE